MEQSNKGHIIYNTYLLPGIKITSTIYQDLHVRLKTRKPLRHHCHWPDFIVLEGAVHVPGKKGFHQYYLAVNLVCYNKICLVA